MNHYGINLAGNIHYPNGFSNDSVYGAIVSVGPAASIKEHTSGLYARKLAEEGFITLAYDSSFRGESGGEPRDQENPNVRVEDIRGAVDFLVSLPYVDDNRIAVLGICAGGGYAATAAMTERRIKAVGAIAPVNGGRENRAAGQNATISSLEQIARLRSAEARGEEWSLSPWMPDEYQNSTDIDQREGYDYYSTPRAWHPNWINQVRSSTMDAVMAFDAFYLAEMLLTQPLQVIVGTKPGSFGSIQDGKSLYDIAASNDKNIISIENASHFDLYDNSEYVDQAVTRLSTFYRTRLQ
ncbi:X-Pro dipeptidyl-peptidase protein [Colletotrichum truncatum]|uniref:X-Pro dipeptidyl-peptidase protein n=1 Tax=Colletotrichum truncatum TaxID=5467 RepID=A0ACC3Z7X0_COLTU